jgi:hypothetical protein
LAAAAALRLRRALCSCERRLERLLVPCRLGALRRRAVSQHLLESLAHVALQPLLRLQQPRQCRALLL